MSSSEKKLAGLRKRIDSLDGRIVRLLNLRTNLAIAIGHLKQREGAPVFSPSREREVVKRVSSVSSGPLQAAHLGPIYREIMSAALSFEGGLVLGVLRGEGAVAALVARHRFGDSTCIKRFASWAGLASAIRAGKVALALVEGNTWKRLSSDDLVVAERVRRADWPAGYVVLGRKEVR